MNMVQVGIVGTHNLRHGDYIELDGKMTKVTAVLMVDKNTRTVVTKTISPNSGMATLKWTDFNVQKKFDVFQNLGR